MIVFTEHSVSRFRERVAPGISREDARARLESLKLSRTHFYSRSGAEYFVAADLDINFLVDTSNEPWRCVTILDECPAELLSRFKMAAWTPERRVG